jgi:hypothetical protein
MSPVSAPAQPCANSFSAGQLCNFACALVAAVLVAATTTTNNTGGNIQQKWKSFAACAFLQKQRAR